MDEFEQFLKEQPLSRPPANWRREILAAASAPAPAESWWRQLFWPAPVAWAAVAALWLLIVGLNLAARPARSPATARSTVPVSEIAVALAEKRELLHELANDNRTPAQHLSVPSPHGKLIRNLPEARYA